MEKVNHVIRTIGSTTFGKEERAVLDYYATNPQAVNDLLNKMPELKQQGLKVLEPCAGGGAIADRYSKLTGNQVDMYDICSRREDIIEMDYMNLECKDKYDVIITNFPYKEATLKEPIGFSQLLLKALHDVKPGGYVCSFQRLLQLESKKRYEKIYGKYKPLKILVYSHRMNCFKNGDFSKKENSAVAYSWVIYQKDSNGFFKNKTELDWIY